MGSVLKIDGAWIKDPKLLEYSLQDLDGEDGSGRNQLGQMFRDRVATKVKLTCEWPPMSADEMSALIKAMDNTFFSVEYPDARTGQRETKTFYVGDRTSPMYTMHDGVWLWSGLTANFIER